MPYAPKRPCPHPGCSALTDGGRCPVHRKENGRAKPVAGDPHNTAAWQRARRRHLAEHPLCVPCQAEGRVVAATTVDHSSNDHARFWDPTDYVSMCASCHSRKTVTVDGGFGRAQVSR